MNIAVVHDYLCGIGGAERVFQYICEAFPHADAYTLAYNPDQSSDYFRSRRLHTTWLNRYVQSMDAFRWSFPLATYAMETIDLSRYDIVLSSSATVAKYVHVPNGQHICYCYIPTRAIWQFDDYFGDSFKGRLFGLFLPFMRRRDLQAAHRVDRFVAISKDSRNHIRVCYQRDADIIHSPIDLERFVPASSHGEHFLVVSRLEHWKRVDYAVAAFNVLGLPLRIIGTGKEEARLKAMAKSNITFLGSVDDATLAQEYREARAVVFTPLLEYGLIPLEANASGTPVICLGLGGIIETMIPWRDDAASNGKATAIFFKEQSVADLVDAVRRFQNASFDSTFLVKHASQWGVPAFKEKLQRLVMEPSP